MKKIYIVTAGEYSDYHIVRVFEDKDLAVKYVDAVNLSSEEYDECDIEEYEIQDTDISYYRGQETPTSISRGGMPASSFQ
jgi:hypothetical protein